MMMRRLAFALFLSLCFDLGWAATTTTWELSSYQDFLRGRLTGLSLSRDGRLMLAPKMDTVFSSDQPEIWSMARASDGTLYLGTGFRGRVYKVETNGRSSVVWTSDQPAIFAVALDSRGGLYAASSPDGRVYRIENGRATEYFNPNAKYVWALAFAQDGALMVGTGDQGKIYRVTGRGQGEVYYDTGQSHITCLAFDKEGRLLAGSEPNGILYRISSKDKAFVLYDANLSEIRAIATAPDGTIYAAAMGGGLGKKTGVAAATSLTSGAGQTGVVTTSITVTDSANAQSGLEVKPKVDQAKPAAQGTPPAMMAITPAVEYAGVDKSALYKINLDNTVETLWSSKDESIYDVALTGNDLVFSTDGQGRIYRLNPDRKTTLLAQTNEGEAMRLLDSSEGLLAATGDMGKLYRLSQGLGTSGVYDSPVHDAGTVARWGRLLWHADAEAGTRLAFRTRSGNSLRPDNTWSEWSEPVSDPANALVRSPNARYIQWRAEFSGSNGHSPMLDDVTVAYLPQNNPPNVRSINVGTQSAPSASQKGSSTSTSTPTASYSITVTDSGESSSAAGTPAQLLSRAPGQQMQISWQADDPDGDKLVYAVYFRGEDEREWKLLRLNFSENSLLLDSDVLADGRYFFRVVASDSPANPPNLAREAELVSAPVLIDNTPPLVTASAPRRSDSHLEIDIEAVDQASPLRRCEYSIDAGPWIPIEAADGVTDSPRERFLLALDRLRPGEHLVVIRVYDAANNAGLTKVVVR